MIPRALLDYLAAGRLRLRVPSRRGDTAYFQRVTDGLKGAAGVVRVDCNPRTASVLLLLEPTVGAVQVRQIGTQRGLFALDRAAPRADVVLNAAGEQLARFCQRLAVVTGGRPAPADLLVGLLLLGLGVRQLLHGEIMAPAATLLVQAYEILSRLDLES